MVCSSFHPAFLGLELWECLYSHPHIWAAPQPSSWDSPFKVKPSSCPALGTDQFVRNSYQVVRHEAGDHELWVCPERDCMSKPYALGHRGCPWKGCHVSDSVQPRGLHSPWNSPGQNTGVGCHALLQGIFPTQGSNPGLSHCRWILYQLSQQGNPPLPLGRRNLWKEDPNYSTKVLGRHLAKAQAVCIRPWGSA